LGTGHVTEGEAKVIHLERALIFRNELLGGTDFEEVAHYLMVALRNEVEYVVDNEVEDVWHWVHEGLSYQEGLWSVRVR
jgi:hypothetical protein